MAYAEGRTDDAISLLESILVQREEGDRRILQEQYFYASEVLASACLRQGNLGEAVRVLERASAVKLVWSWEWWGRQRWMRVELRLARVYRQLGRETQATEIEDEIRALLAYADDDLWMVRYLEGTAEFQRLIIESHATDDIADVSDRRMDNLP